LDFLRFLCFAIYYLNEVKLLLPKQTIRPLSKYVWYLTGII